MTTQTWRLLILFIVIASGMGLFVLNEYHEDRHNKNAITAKEINGNNIAIMDSAMTIARRIKIDTVLSKEIINALKGRYVVRTFAEMDSIIEANKIDFDGLLSLGFDAVISKPTNVVFDSVQMGNNWTTSFDIKTLTDAKGVVFSHGINEVSISDMYGVKIDSAIWNNFVISADQSGLKIHKNGVLSKEIKDRPKDTTGVLEIQFHNIDVEIKNFMIWNETKDGGFIYENRENYRFKE